MAQLAVVSKALLRSFQSRQDCEGGLPGTAPPAWQTPQTSVRVRREARAPRASSPQPPPRPHSPARRTPRPPCLQEAAPPKRRVSQGHRCTNNDQFLKTFSTWPLVPRNRKSQAVGGLRMNLQRPQSQLTSRPQVELLRPFLVNIGGGHIIAEGPLSGPLSSVMQIRLE